MMAGWLTRGSRGRGLRLNSSVMLRRTSVRRICLSSPQPGFAANNQDLTTEYTEYTEKSETHSFCICMVPSVYSVYSVVQKSSPDKKK